MNFILKYLSGIFTFIFTFTVLPNHIPPLSLSSTSVRRDALTVTYRVGLFPHRSAYIPLNVGIEDIRPKYLPLQLRKEHHKFYLRVVDGLSPRDMAE